MRIGMVATRLAGVDGVTFETAKWEAVLERMGHEVRLCAGEVDALRSTARLVPAMHFTHPPAARVTAAAFDPDSDAEAVAHEIQRLADQLLPVLDAWIETERLDAAHGRERVGDTDAAAARRGAPGAGREDRAARPSATTTTTGGSASGSPRASSPTSWRRRFRRPCPPSVT